MRGQLCGLEDSQQKKMQKELISFKLGYPNKSIYCLHEIPPTPFESFAKISYIKYKKTLVGLETYLYHSLATPEKEKEEIVEVNTL